MTLIRRTARGDAMEDSAVTPKAVDKAEQAGNSASLEVAARVGLIAFGLVHLLVGWLALLIAWGAAAGSADNSGALMTLADQPFGKIMLWLVAFGLAALAIWQASEAVWGCRRHDGASRVRMQVISGAKAVVSAALGVSAALVALGSGSSSSESQEQATTGVLGLPGGQVIVVATGLIIIGIGVASVVKGVRRSFDEEIDTASMPSAVRKGVCGLGQVGYIAKGLALGVVGGLLSYAALTSDRQQGQGLDGALQQVLAQPFGRFLLTAVAIGFGAFGLFAMLQAWYRRM